MLNPVKYIRFLFNVYRGWKSHKHESHVSFWKQVWESYNLLRSNKMEPYEYYKLKLYDPKITWDEKKKFMSYNQIYLVESYMNPRKEVAILNKFNFSVYAKQFGIPTPEMIGLFNPGTGFTTKGKSLKTIDDLKELFSNPDITDFVIKPTSSGESKGVLICNNLGENIIRVYNEKDYSIEELFNKLISTNFNNMKGMYDTYLIEKKVKQHKFLDNYSTTCTQSMRIITFLTSSGDVEIVASSLKIAKKGNFVDNLTILNLGAGIEKSGILREALEFADTESGNYITWNNHPDTGYPIKGEKVPFFEESIILAKKAQSMIPFLRAIAWDITITDNGPVIFEGNYGYLIHMFQKMRGEGFLNTQLGSEALQLMERQF